MAEQLSSYIYGEGTISTQQMQEQKQKKECQLLMKLGGGTINSTTAIQNNFGWRWIWIQSRKQQHSMHHPLGA